MKPLAFLEYAFMFEPTETWSNIHAFERDLADFFAAHGLEAQVLKTVDGATGRRILFVRKIELLTIAPPTATPGRPKSIKRVFNDMAQRNPKAGEKNFNKGKFLPRKGYLKREA